MPAIADELDTEIHRLRIRLISLTSGQLDADARGPEGEFKTGTSRREAIGAALREFSDIGSHGWPVPVLGDRNLADQVVVLLDHGKTTAAWLADGAGAAQIEALTEAAVRLRRMLA